MESAEATTAAPRAKALARARRLAPLVPWLLLALFALRGLAGARADGTVADEARHLAYGERGLREGTFLRPDPPLWSSKMPVSMLNAAAAALLDDAAASDWSRRLFAARLPTLALGILLGWLVWSWARELYGPGGAALALLLYTCCPNFLAHAHLVNTDVATCLGMFASVYTLWRYLQQPATGRLIAAAAVFGLAQLTKASVLLLVPIVALALLVHALESARRAAGAGSPWRAEPGELARQLRRAAGVLLLLAVAAVAALNLGFRGEGTLTPLREHAFVSPTLRAAAATPLLRDVPLPLPFPYLQGLDLVAHDSMAPSWSYLRGEHGRSGFRAYFLWAFLVKVPLATQALIALALIAWLARRRPERTAVVTLWGSAVVIMAYLTFSFRIGVGFRFALPALPFLFVFAGGARGPWPAGARGRAAAGAVVAALVWLAWSSWSVHPRYIPYFNEVAGGPSGGWRWLIDSNLDWGQDAERVRRLHGGPGRPPLLVDPSGPVAGRVAVGLSDLVGREPAGARRHAWLRTLRPVATVGHSWWIFEVTEEDLRRCCRELRRAAVLPDLTSDLALAARPIGGAEGAELRFLERLNDGMLGAGEPVDAVRSAPARPRPVRAWFGLEWPAPVTLARVVAHPGFVAAGPRVTRYLATDYRFEAWRDGGWRPIPGAAGRANAAPRVEHRFAPLRTTRLRLLVERQRNGRGDEAEGEAGFRAACLELAAYPR